MSLEAMADAIVARLEGAFPGRKVDHFPDIPDRKLFLKARSDMLVAHEGETFGAVQSFEPFSCDRTVTVSVTLVVRSLRGPKGAQVTLDAIRRALFGFKTPLGGTPLAPTRIDCLGEDQGVWIFVSYFATTTVAVATTQPLTGPAFTEATEPAYEPTP